MKKTVLIILTLSLFLSFAACGKAPPTPTAVPTEAPAEETAAPAETDAPEENADKATAESYVGKELSELTAVIGEPISAEYASSCLGKGQDGELKYDGFTVYTYKEGAGEEIISVK